MIHIQVLVHINDIIRIEHLHTPGVWGLFFILNTSEFRVELIESLFVSVDRVLFHITPIHSSFSNS